MIATLVLCEGRSDLNFIKGILRKRGIDDIKFILGPERIEKHIRSNFYNMIVYSIGGKGSLHKYARNMISVLRSMNGSIDIIYVKDMVHGNRIVENLETAIMEFITLGDKFSQDKPRIDVNGNIISVSFKNLRIKYHVFGVPVSLEDEVWKRVLKREPNFRDLNRRYDDVHDKLCEYCRMKDIEIDEFFQEAPDMFSSDDGWFRKLRNGLNEIRCK